MAARGPRQAVRIWISPGGQHAGWAASITGRSSKGVTSGRGTREPEGRVLWTVGVSVGGGGCLLGGRKEGSPLRTLDQ